MLKFRRNVRFQVRKFLLIEKTVRREPWLVDAEERVGVKCRLHNLQKWSLVKRRKVLEDVAGAISQAVVWVDDAVAEPSPRACSVADPRIDNLTGS